MVRIGPIGDWHVDRSIPSGYVLGTPYQAIQGLYQATQSKLKYYQPVLVGNDRILTDTDQRGTGR